MVAQHNEDETEVWGDNCLPERKILVGKLWFYKRNSSPSLAKKKKILQERKIPVYLTSLIDNRHVKL